MCVSLCVWARAQTGQTSPGGIAVSQRRALTFRIAFPQRVGRFVRMQLRFRRFGLLFKSCVFDA